MDGDYSVESSADFEPAAKRKAGKGTEVISNSNYGARKIARTPRVVRDGKVAVIYQPHHGLGWYSEHRIEALLYAPEIVDMIERDAPGSKVYDYCRKMNYGWSVMDTICYGLCVKWVPISEEFRIHESNGRDSVVLKSADKWFLA